MTSIGILVTGRMGIRLARMFANSGQHVILGSRDSVLSARIAQALEHSNVNSGSYEDAVAADFILPAVFLRDGLLDMLEPLRIHLDGKVYIDMAALREVPSRIKADISNPFNDTYTDFILPWDTSSAEQIQHRFPKTRVVGAFKNVWWEVFDAPTFGETVSDVYVVSDDSQAKAQFLNVVENTPFRYVDAGRLTNARTIERMTLLSGELGQRYGYFPRMNYKLLGDPWTLGQADRVASLIASGAQ